MVQENASGVLEILVSKRVGTLFQGYKLENLQSAAITTTTIASVYRQFFYVNFGQFVSPRILFRPFSKLNLWGLV